MERRTLFGRRALARRLARARADDGPQLEDGARVAVIGGGPAGAFFSYFLLRLANSLGMRVSVDIYEPRRFEQPGPGGCNHCGGVVSESLVQLLALDGIQVPPSVPQRGIDAYVLHTDNGTVRIETPLNEKRIAAVYRGGGPKGSDGRHQSFDQFLLGLAAEKGAHVVPAMVTDLNWTDDGRPVLTCADGGGGEYDLVTVATGVNSRLLEVFERKIPGFRRPQTTTAFVSEFHLGSETVQARLGSAMHVFLLDLPRLEFAALIPKDDSVTLCLLGEDIDSELVEAFLNADEVRELFPPETGVPRNCCQCIPRINIGGAPQPFADRLLFVGDSGVTRLYKDGVGAAYRTGKSAATAALLGGISAEAFRRHYRPATRRLAIDNAIGRIVFAVNGMMQGMGFTRRAIVEMTAREQASAGSDRAMSTVLWDVFTGSAPYKEILLRSLHPAFLARLGWHLGRALLPGRPQTKTLGDGHGH